MKETLPCKPLRILQLKKDSAEVEILTENLDIICRSLQQAGANLVSIVAVMGTYRTGKSFLLDLLMRHLKKKVATESAAEIAAAQARAKAMEMLQASANANISMEELEGLAKSILSKEPKANGLHDNWHFGAEDRNRMHVADWVYEGNSARITEGSKLDDASEGFAWRPGKEKCTQGIWLWSSPFVFTDKEDGRRVGVLLMDTQGAWDDTMTKAQSATIFGLTALLSSKLIYNIQNRVEEDKLENMDYITTFAQTVVHDLPGREAPFGHLELLVRDWVHYEDGFTAKDCKEQMSQHLDDHLSPTKVPGDAIPRVERLVSSFKSISCTGLPHPGLQVTKPQYNGDIDVIDRDFLHLLDDFTRSLFGGFPQPSAPLGFEITTDSFKQIVVNFAQAFRESAGDMAIGLREAFVKVELVTCRDSIIKKFREQLARLAPETSVVDPVKLKQDTDRIKSNCREEFLMKLKPWRMKEQDELQAVSDFMQTINEAVSARVMVNDQQVEGATIKLVAAPVVGCAGYFLLDHTMLLTALVAAGGYMDAKKWAAENNVEMYDPLVIQGVGEDAKKWCVQRWKDIQAIEVAMQRFSPNDALETLMKASSKASAAMNNVSSDIPMASMSSSSSNGYPHPVGQRAPAR